MKYKFPIILFFLFVNISLSGQDSTGKDNGYSLHVIGISAGVNQIKEENLVPLVHTGYVLNVQYEYRNLKENYQNIELILGFSRIVANPEDITKSLNILIESSYNYCFHLVRKSDFHFFLGPQAGGSYSLSYFPNWDDSHVYWANYFTLGTTALGEYILNESQRFQFSLSIPVLSFFSRPEFLRLYKADDSSFGEIFKNSHRNMKAGLWDSVFSLRFGIEYQFPVFRTKTEAISYSLDYTRIKGNDGNPFQQLIHQIGLKIML